MVAQCSKQLALALSVTSSPSVFCCCFFLWEPREYIFSNVWNRSLVIRLHCWHSTAIQATSCRRCFYFFQFTIPISPTCIPRWWHPFHWCSVIFSSIHFPGRREMSSTWCSSPDDQKMAHCGKRVACSLQHTTGRTEACATVAVTGMVQHYTTLR